MALMAKFSLSNVPSRIVVARGDDPQGPSRRPRYVSPNGVRPASLYFFGFRSSKCDYIPSFVVSATTVPSSSVTSFLAIGDLTMLTGVMAPFMSR
jgi:hypothetical protein